MTVNATHETPPEGGSAPAQGALLTDEQTRWLRRAVVGMTAILVAGIALLIGRVIYLARAGAAQAPSGFAALPILPAMSLPLPAGAAIKSVTASGNRLVVHHSTADGRETMLVLDLATGQIVSRIAIDRATP